MLHENAKYSYPIDIWGIGITLYLLCAFTYPFANLNRAVTMKSIRKAILKGQYPPIKGDYSDEMKHMIDKTLTVDVDKRYTASEMLRIVEKKLKEYK